MLFGMKLVTSELTTDKSSKVLFLFLPSFWKNPGGDIGRD